MQQPGKFTLPLFPLDFAVLVFKSTMSRRRGKGGVGWEQMLNKL